MNQAAKTPYPYGSDTFSGRVAPEWRPKGSWLSKAAIAFATIDVRKMLTESTATFAELRDETPESFFQQSRLTGKERDDELLAKLHGEERAAWQRYRGALSAARVNLMSRLQLGSLIAFGDREWHRSDPEWIPVPAWEHLDFDTQQKGRYMRKRNLFLECSGNRPGSGGANCFPSTHSRRIL